MAKAI